MKFAILAAIAAIASPAVAADQFDLVCTGQVAEQSVGSKAPITTRYRIDLGANKWCRDDCTATEQFAKVSEDRLSFRDHPRRWTQDDQQFEFVSRLDGYWLDSFSSGKTTSMRRAEGRCERAAFSGFPKVATKF